MCLQVLLDWCVSEPVLQRHQGGYRAVMNTSALIRDVQLINCVLLCWRLWGRADTRVWHVGLQALAALVRGDHPHRGFNVQQMQNVQLVHKITMIFLVSPTTDTRRLLSIEYLLLMISYVWSLWLLLMFVTFYCLDYLLTFLLNWCINIKSKGC